MNVPLLLCGIRDVPKFALGPGADIVKLAGREAKAHSLEGKCFDNSATIRVFSAWLVSLIAAITMSA